MSKKSKYETVLVLQGGGSLGAYECGVKDIGGNQFLVKDKDTTLFMDFGMSFSQEGQCVGIK